MSAAARSAILARYQTQSVPRKPPAASDKSSEVGALSQAQETQSDSIQPADPKPLSSPKWHTFDVPDNDDAGSVAESMQSVATSAITVLPTQHGWQRMITRNITVAELQQARKYGQMEQRGGAKAYKHNDVVYITDLTGKKCVTCWKEKLTADDLLKGQSLLVRACDLGMRSLQGPEGRAIIRALEAQFNVRLLLLRTGHVQLAGPPMPMEHAAALVDDLLDSDGVAAREQLANHLRLSASKDEMTVNHPPERLQKGREEEDIVLEAQCTRVSVPAALVGKIIGPGGEGVAAIKRVSGIASIVYEDCSSSFAIHGRAQAARIAVRKIQEQVHSHAATAEVERFVQVAPENEAAVGKVIGKGGETIKAIKAESGARVIYYDEISNQFVIKGTAAQADAARQRVEVQVSVVTAAKAKKAEKAERAAAAKAEKADKAAAEKAAAESREASKAAAEEAAEANAVEEANAWSLLLDEARAAAAAATNEVVAQVETYDTATGECENEVECFVQVPRTHENAVLRFFGSYNIEAAKAASGARVLEFHRVGTRGWAIKAATAVQLEAARQLVEAQVSAIVAGRLAAAEKVSKVAQAKEAAEAKADEAPESDQPSF